MIRMTSTLAAFAVSLLLVPSPGTAQVETDTRSTTTGLSVGVHASSASLFLVDDESRTLGGGLGVNVGFGISPGFALHLSTSGAVLSPAGGDHWLLGHADLEARFNFADAFRRWVPHLAVGVGLRTANFEVENATDPVGDWHGNPGFTMGGGISYFLSPSVSMDASLRYSFGNLRRLTCPKSGETSRTCATSTRLNLGASWHRR